jgi:hypothetical protein
MTVLDWITKAGGPDASRSWTKPQSTEVPMQDGPGPRYKGRGSGRITVLAGC